MKKLYKLRFIPLIISSLFVFVNFILLAGVLLPYQNPTIEMLEKQIADIHFHQNLNIIGFCLIVLSIWLSVFLQRYKTKRSE